MGGFARSPWERFKERRAAVKQQKKDAASPPPLFTIPSPGHIMPRGMAIAQPLLSAAANGMNGRYIDIANDQFQCRIERPKGETGAKYLDRAEKRAQKSKGTAVWEGGSPHDSLDLLNFYLKALGIHRRARAWMLVDLIESCDENAIANTIRDWEKAYQTHESAETDPQKKKEVYEKRLAMLEKMTGPYQALEHSWDAWRATDAEWWDTGYISTAGALIAPELDGFLWKMRQHRIGPMARHAMLRDLLSQPTEKRYKALRERLLKEVEGDGRTAWEDDVQRKLRMDRLINEYNRKIDFDRHRCMSQEEVNFDRQAMTENRVPSGTQDKILWRKRWGLAKEPWQVLLRRLDLGEI